MIYFINWNSVDECNESVVWHNYSLNKTKSFISSPASQLDIIKSNKQTCSFIDFDNDKHIGPSDIDQALTLLTRQELTPEEKQQIVEKVIEEADVDGDGKLSYMEFDHVITRAPDFLSTFHIRIWILC